MSKNITRLALSAVAVATALSGCASQKLIADADQTRSDIEAKAGLIGSGLSSGQPTVLRGSAEHADRLAQEQVKSPSLRRATRPFISATMVPVTDEDKLPAIFHVRYEMDFASSVRGVPTSLDQVAARLTKLTGVPVRLHADVYGSPGVMTSPRIAMAGRALPSSGAPMPSPVLTNEADAEGDVAPAPINTSSVATAQPISLDGIEMRWSGTIAGFLNHLVDRLGLSWEYRDNTVVIQRYVTEFHQIAALPGAVTYTMSAGGSSSGTSGGNSTSTTATSQLDVSEKGQMDVISTMEKAIQNMISAVPGSSVTRAEGSGRLIVKTSREMQSQVREFVRTENVSMLRQAQIQMDIYSVTTDVSDERGVDWSVIFRSANGVLQGTLASPTTLAGSTAGTVSAAIVSGIGGNEVSTRLGDSKLILQALAQQGYSAQHRPVSLLSLNRQWARKSRLNTQGYLAETVPGVASSTGVGIPGLKTDKFTVGDQYVALPQILDDNSVLLKFGVSLSDLVGLFDVTVGSGSSMQKVQTPEISAVNDQYTVALKPGEVMVLTGFSRIVSSNDQRTLSERLGVGFGGSRTVSTKREHFIVLIRPVLL